MILLNHNQDDLLVHPELINLNLIDQLLQKEVLKFVIKKVQRLFCPKFLYQINNVLKLKLNVHLDNQDQIF
jgi:hypothetical protein